MTSASTTDRFAKALSATGDLIAGVGSTQWSNSTPYPEWNVRALVNHLVFGNWMFASILSGERPPAPEDLARQGGIDHLGDDPVQAYREAGAELNAAFTGEDVLEREFQAPVGRVSGSVLLHFRVTELLIHGWDLAHATGQSDRLPDDLAEEELAFARGQYAHGVARTGHLFAPAQPVAADARAIDRLAAYLGRPIAARLTEVDRD